MNLLIFSDSHLTHVYDERKFQFLHRIISASDRVVINGDFWDGYLTTFDKFIRSPWNRLFPLLLTKKAIHIYGNHDSPDLSDVRASLFSTQQHDQIKIKSGDILLRIEHGQEIYKLSDKSIPRFLRSPGTKLHSLVRRLHFRINSRGFAAFYRRPNRHFKKISKTLNREVLIVGHSHGAELSLSENLVNSGFIDWGFGSYIICENGKIELRVENY